MSSFLDEDINNHDAFQSDWINAPHVQRQPERYHNITVSNVTEEEKDIILYFQELDTKKLGVNVGNKNAIIAISGSVTPRGWIGAKVRLGTVETNKSPGVRIHPAGDDPAPQVAMNATATVPAPQVAPEPNAPRIPTTVFPPEMTKKPTEVTPAPFPASQAPNAVCFATDPRIAQYIAVKGVDADALNNLCDYAQAQTAQKWSVEGIVTKVLCFLDEGLPPLNFNEVIKETVAKGLTGKETVERLSEKKAQVGDDDEDETLF